MYPYIKIFSFTIPSYWLMAMMGIFAAVVFLFIRNRKIDLPKDDVLHIVLFLVIGAMIGGKLLYIITALPYIIMNFSVEVLAGLVQGGFVFYGGFIGAVYMGWQYCKKYNVSNKKTLALFTPAIPLFHAFGRVGCFLAGCCWGMEVPYGIVFTNSIGAPNGVPLLPVQLIEVGLNLLICAILVFVQNRKARTAPLEDFNVFGLYIVLYSIIRFVLEFFRGDVLRGMWLFSTSQWISLLFIAGFIFFKFYKKNKTYRVKIR